MLSFLMFYHMLLLALNLEVPRHTNIENVPHGLGAQTHVSMSGGSNIAGLGQVPPSL